jgi:hypothetical protein
MEIGGLGTPEIIVILVTLVLVGLGLVLTIFYLLTISRTLAAVSEQHRRMNPRISLAKFNTSVLPGLAFLYCP